MSAGYKTAACGLAIFFWVLLLAPIAAAQSAPTGYQPRVTVQSAGRIDWTFPLANQSVGEEKIPAEWTADYQSVKQQYELYIPGAAQTGGKPMSLVLFISSSDKPAGWTQFKSVCEQRGIAFAAPFGVGNNTPMPRRVHIALDVLDDLQRRYRIDSDRVYIGGISGGARVAHAIALALPECFGGILPVCAGGELREEPWLRQRMVDRLSIAMITGETDFNRGEVERYWSTLLSEAQVRNQVWVVDGQGHGMPAAKIFDQAWQWLEAGLAKRRELAGKHPAMRWSSAMATREGWAEALLSEAKKRLAEPATRYMGLMQVKGVYDRWQDLPTAPRALEILQEAENAADQSWQKQDIAEQRRHLIAEARAMDRYASGPLPKQYADQKEGMLKSAISLWLKVMQDGQDEKAVQEARRRLPELKKMLDETP